MIKNENQVFLVLGAKPNPPKLKLNFFISLVETLSPLPFVSSIPFLFLVTLQPGKSLNLVLLSTFVAKFSKNKTFSFLLLNLVMLSSFSHSN
ncbi:hypothetical protein AAZX31_04G114400 [Glycine max]